MPKKKKKNSSNPRTRMWGSRGPFPPAAATVVSHWSRTECEAGMPVLPVINRDVNEVLHMLPFRQLKILGLK
jgi:hypothetical protein